jgi:segregation and condensation protein B
MHDPQHLRLVEALLFASAKPIDEEALASRLPKEVDVPGVLAELATLYAERGINLVRRGDGWAFRTAPDMGAVLAKETILPRKLPRAAAETLAIVAYHQPVTRAEIEDIRGVSVSQGTLDILFEAGWVAPQGRRETPGRPTMWGTTPVFLDHFGLKSLDDLPGLEELKASGLLDANPAMPTYAARAHDELPGGDGTEPPIEPLNADEGEAQAAADQAEEPVAAREADEEPAADGFGALDAADDEEEGDEGREPGGYHAIGGNGRGSNGNGHGNGNGHNGNGNGHSQGNGNGHEPEVGIGDEEELERSALADAILNTPEGDPAPLMVGDET